MGRKVDLTGQRFGMLVVLGDSGERGNGAVMWDCICDCGEKFDEYAARKLRF